MKMADRRARIVRAAARLFVANGYSGVSMDDVQIALSCSKSTLYRYFDDKTDLFRSAVEMLIFEGQEPVRDFHPETSDVGEALREWGRHFAAVVLDPQAIRLHRLVCAEAERVSGIGQAFVASGPDVGKAILGRYLQQLSDDGLIAIADPVAAAGLLYQAMLGDVQLALLMNVDDPPGAEQVEANIDAAVDIFLSGVRA